MKTKKLKMVREFELVNDARFEGGAGWIAYAIEKSANPDEYGCVNLYEVLLKDPSPKDICFGLLEDDEVDVELCGGWQVDEKRVV